MKSLNITLKDIDSVKSFVNAVSMQAGDFDIVSDRYVVDAKSIMGILSLDISKTLRLNIHDNVDYDSAIEVLKPYIV
ncbi:MAG: HPr family phosphocarrier protein [Clostridiales bacterium]|nr:HPr family phosphocarrier protein [Clostridiales bacterium]